MEVGCVGLWRMLVDVMFVEFAVSCVSYELYDRIFFGFLINFDPLFCGQLLFYFLPHLIILDRLR